MARKRDADDAETSVLAVIEAELRAQEGPESFADDVWDQMRAFQTRDGGFNAIAQLAIEGVRPFYRALLLRSQVSSEATKWAEDVVYARDGESRFQPYGTQVALEEFTERLAKLFRQVELPGGEVLVQTRRA